MKKLTSVLTIIAFLFAANFSQAQDATLPDVDELLKNYLEIIGGEEAWKAKNSMKMSGSAEQMGMAFPIIISSMRPNMQRVEVDVQGQKLVEAFDGEVAWSINPFMGSTEPIKKTDEETSEAAKQMFEDDFIDWKEKGHQVTVEGAEEVDGVNTIKVKLVKADGDEVHYFFDPEVNVPIMRRDFMSFGPMKGKPMDTYMSDYNEVDDVIVPLSIEQKVDGETIMKMTADSVMFNVPMEKENFMMPKK
jgi:hypothetical protein